jgi:hypothetical protein
MTQLATIVIPKDQAERKCNDAYAGVHCQRGI